jgi:hypothetical protein
MHGWLLLQARAQCAITKQAGLFNMSNANRLPPETLHIPRGMGYECTAGPAMAVLRAVQHC